MSRAARRAVSLFRVSRRCLRLGRTDGTRAVSDGQRAVSDRWRAPSPTLWRVRPRQRVGPLLSLVAVAALVMALVGCAGNSGARSDSTPTEAPAPGTTSETGFDGGLLPAGVKPHAFTLTDQYGRRVSLSSFRGKVVILAFLYSTSKATAPLIAQQVRGALDELEEHEADLATGHETGVTTGRETGGHETGAATRRGAGVAALAVSVDPTADTRAHVRAFLRATSLTGRLEYLTSSRTRLDAVWRAYRVVPASAGEGAYERGAFVLLLDKTGAERVNFSLEELTPEGLAHDVRKLEAE
jgi:protein SCO1/2